MKILAIETSCDETGICVISKKDELLEVSGNALSSQIELHAKYGGVFPAMAKRAHAAKIIPLIIEALLQANLLAEELSSFGETYRTEIENLCTKETEMIEPLISFFNTYAKPDIAYIAVTIGPGLEPALWVGINTAKVLGKIWNIPIIPINHMEGHIITAALEKKNEQIYKINKLENTLSLLISGGHTELVLEETLLDYKKIGQTRDDAVGEAFDKVARMLDLAYPGGPKVSAYAQEFRDTHIKNPFTLPRPMMYSDDYDFSFSGIKTAALYLIRDLTNNKERELSHDEKIAIACAFEDAVIDVLKHKTKKAIEEYGVQNLIIGGGVAGNTRLRKLFTESFEPMGITLFFPEPWLATDNGIMIGVTAFYMVTAGKIKTSAPENLVADGNLSF